MIAAIYARKSTEQTGVAEDQRSVTRQIEHARAFAVRKGWTVSDDAVFVDDGVSGAEFAGRPGFVRLMNALKPRPAFQALVMSEESRLGREAIETAYALKQLISAGVRVFFYLEDRERTLDSPTDKIMMSLTAFADELEREKARQRTYDAMLRKARAGHVTGGRVFGYDNVDVVGPNGERAYVALRINEPEAVIVRRIFELSSRGEGLRTIAKRLNAEHVASPRAQQGRPNGWAPSSVRCVLFRETYRGRRIWNQTKKRDAWGRKARTDRPATEWLTIDVEAHRIVPEILWEAAHARMVNRRTLYDRWKNGDAAGAPDGRGVRRRYFLTGFSRCAQCGGSMQVVSRKSKSGERRFLYTCSTYWNRGVSVCSNGRTVPMCEADRAVHDLIRAEILKPSIIEAAIERAVELLAGGDAARERVDLVARLQDVQKALGNLTETAARGGAVPAVLEALSARDAERRRLVSDLAALDRRQTQHNDRPRTARTQLRALLGDWRALLTDNVSEARPLLEVVLAGRIDFQAADNGYALTVPVSLDRVLTAIVPELRMSQDVMASPRGTDPNLRTNYRVFLPAGKVA